MKNDAIRITPLCELAAVIRPHGVDLSYGQLHRRAASGVFPVIKRSNRVFAVGEPDKIAQLIAHDERRHRRNSA